MGMLSDDQLMAMGFAAVGSNVQISEKASFYGVNKIYLGSNIRIDDFCVISAGSGGIRIGNHVHIAVSACLIGSGLIVLSDFVGISSRAIIYSSNDDYSGAALTGPTIPAMFTNVTHLPVFVGKHVVIGSGSVVLPGVSIGEGAAVGALTLVNRSCESFAVYGGNPMRRIKDRKRDLLRLEEQLLQFESDDKRLRGGDL